MLGAGFCFATRDIRKGETLNVLYDGLQSLESGTLIEQGKLNNPGEFSRGPSDSGVDGPHIFTLSAQRSYPCFANDPPLRRPDLVNSHLIWDCRRQRGILQPMEISLAVMRYSTNRGANLRHWTNGVQYLTSISRDLSRG